MLGRLSDAIEALPIRLAVVFGGCITVALGVIDRLTGPDIAFSIFYLVPTAIGAWSGGLALGLPLAIAGAATWLIADVLAGSAYAHPLIAAWNTTTRLAVFALVAILLSELHRSLGHERQLARTDPLTGVANSRAFMEQATVEVQRSRRYRRPLALVYIDLDDFKRVNDEQGHSAGDALLSAVALHLRQRTRDTDLIARLGGDEFAILLRDTDAAGTASLIASLPMRTRSDSEGPVIGFSIGAVTFEMPPRSVDEMIAEADRLMYLAKEAGKASSRHLVVPVTAPIPAPN